MNVSSRCWGMETHNTTSCAFSSNTTSTRVSFLFQPRLKAGVGKPAPSAARYFGQRGENTRHFIPQARIWPYGSRHLGQRVQKYKDVTAVLEIAKLQRGSLVSGSSATTNLSGKQRSKLTSALTIPSQSSITAL